jgi:hypothetical protein
MVEEFGNGNVEGKLAAFDFEIDTNAAGLAAAQEPLGNGPEMKFPPKLVGNFIQDVHIAAGADERVQSLAERAGKIGVFRFVQLDAGDGNALDYILLINVAFGGRAFERLAAREPGDKRGEKNREGEGVPEADASKGHCGAFRNWYADT